MQYCILFYHILLYVTYYISATLGVTISATTRFLMKVTTKVTPRISVAFDFRSLLLVAPYFGGNLKLPSPKPENPKTQTL